MSQQPRPLSRRAFGRRTLLAAGGTALGVSAARAGQEPGSAPGLTDRPDEAGHAPDSAPVRRSFTEYLLPKSEQTHEIARVPGSRLVLVTQMPESRLIKLRLAPGTEEITGIRSFRIGTPASELHGLYPSSAYPGLVWASLQADNKILLIDPGTTLGAAPAVEKTIDVPAPGNGPHTVIETGDRVWAGLKYPSEQDGKFYVFSADHRRAGDEKLYPCLPQPVFVQQEPGSGDFYVSQDAASSIMRITPATGRTAQLPVPGDIGENPVGMMTGTGRLAGVWVTLAGSKTSSTGAFGRIREDGNPHWFRLTTRLGRRSGLLHLADATRPGGPPALWLLSTSLLNEDSPDALVHVTFDDAVTKILGEEFTALPTQTAKTHRVLPLRRSVLVSEWNTSTVAQLTYAGTGPGTWSAAPGTTTHRH